MLIGTENLFSFLNYVYTEVFIHLFIYACWYFSVSSIYSQYIIMQALL